MKYIINLQTTPYIQHKKMQQIHLKSVQPKKIGSSGIQKISRKSKNHSEENGEDSGPFTYIKKGLIQKVQRNKLDGRQKNGHT